MYEHLTITLYIFQNINKINHRFTGIDDNWDNINYMYATNCVYMIIKLDATHSIQIAQKLHFVELFKKSVQVTSRSLLLFESHLVLVAQVCPEAAD